MQVLTKIPLCLHGSVFVLLSHFVICKTKMLLSLPGTAAHGRRAFLQDAVLQGHVINCSSGKETLV